MLTSPVVSLFCVRERRSRRKDGSSCGHRMVPTSTIILAILFIANGVRLAWCVARTPHRRPYTSPLLSARFLTSLSRMPRENQKQYWDAFGEGRGTEEGERERERASWRTSLAIASAFG